MKTRRGGFTWVEMLVLLGVIGILAAILYPAFVKGGHKPSPRVSCVNQLKQLGTAMMQYSQEYDERFPPVKLSNRPVVIAQHSSPQTANNYQPFGWLDALWVYAQDTNIYHCPSETQVPKNDDPTQNGYTDYWFNTNLSNLELGRLVSPTQTILMGDGNDGSEITNARYNRNSLPQRWRDEKGSPARRHLNTGNYLFSDGHVKSIKPELINNLTSQQSTYRHSFSFR